MKHVRKRVASIILTAIVAAAFAVAPATAACVRAGATVRVVSTQRTIVPVTSAADGSGGRLLSAGAEDAVRCGAHLAVSFEELVSGCAIGRRRCAFKDLASED